MIRLVVNVFCIYFCIYTILTKNTILYYYINKNNYKTMVLRKNLNYKF